jgi:hypothetical protein
MTNSVVVSVAGSAAFFVMFTISLGFWGCQILRLAKITQDVGYGDPLPLVAFVSTIAVILRYLHYYTTKFDLIFLALFALGIFGLVAEIVLFCMRKFKNYNTKWEIVKDVIHKNSSLFVGTIICIILSTYVCLIWPSRTMEPWLTRNIDYYTWIFLGDYWRGVVDVGNFGLKDIGIWANDSFGSFIFIGLFDSAKGGLSVTAAAYFVVTILSWIGISLYSLIRTIFKLNIVLALLLSVSVVGGNFFNFISFNGLFGHLIGLFGFLTCLMVIFKIDINSKLKEFYIRLFFPILFLFVCYQAVFFVFMCMVLLAIFLVGIFSNYTDIKDFPLIVIKYIKKSIITIMIPIGVSCIILPVVAVEMFHRTVNAATQQAGIRLKLIEPDFFSGIPIYNENFVNHSTNGSYASYLILIICVIILAVIVTSKKNDSINKEFKIKIKSITILFLACVVVYLGYYAVKGDSYLVWKYAGYSLLPLSFVTSSLFFASIYRLIKGNKILYPTVCCIIGIILLIPQILAINSPFYGSLGKNTSGKSLSPLIYLLTEVYKIDKSKSKVIFDLWFGEMNTAAALISINSNKQIYLLQGMYFFPRNLNYFPLLDVDTVIYTDKQFNGLYNSYLKPPREFVLYRYEYSDLDKSGAVAYLGLRHYALYAEDSIVELKILLPRDIRGNDINLTVEVPFTAVSGNEHCQKIKVSYPDGSLVEDGKYQNGFFEAVIPKARQNNGFVDIVFDLPKGETGRPDQPGGAVAKPDCGFRFNGVSVGAAG